MCDLHEMAECARSDAELGRMYGLLGAAPVTRSITPPSAAERLVSWFAAYQNVPVEMRGTHKGNV